MGIVTPALMHVEAPPEEKGELPPMEDLVKKIGVDPAEYTNGTGNGMVHVYQGKSGPAVVSGATDAYAFWADYTKMSKYDILINALGLGRPCCVTTTVRTEAATARKPQRTATSAAVSTPNRVR